MLLATLNYSACAGTYGSRANMAVYTGFDPVTSPVTGECSPD